jgi:peptidylprolyl isomerase
MARDPGQTIGDARPFQISESPRTVRQSLGLRDRADIWSITTSIKSSFNLTLEGLVRGADADISLLNSANDVIRSSKNRRNRSETLSEVPLEIGTYYIKVQLQPKSADTRYALTLSATPVPSPSVTPVPSPVDRFANSLETSTVLAVGAAVSTASDFVGNVDSNDYLKFTVSLPGQLNLGLSGLGADANLKLYDNNLNLIAESSNAGIAAETISQRLTNFGSTYYINIAQAPSTDTNYSFNYSFTPDSPITTASGLKYIDLVPGTGAIPVTGDTVLANYTGTLENGTQFDSSIGRQPFVFELGVGRVIAGWDEAFSTIKVGGRRQLIIPPNLGYGATGQGSIPPNATLIFDVELLGIY